MSKPKTDEPYYSEVAAAKARNVEASAWDENNKKSPQPQFFKMKLNTLRIPNNTAKADLVIKEGRFNRIFMVDSDPQGITAIILVKLSDNQGNDELLPLYAGAVLAAENGKVWTRVEFYNESIDKTILVGVAMNISYQQNLVSLANSKNSSNDLAVDNTTVSLPDGVPTLICLDLVGVCKTRCDSLQNKSGRLIKLGYNSDMTTGPELADNLFAVHGSLVGLYALCAGAVGTVNVMSTMKEF
ncbi:MAG: hypothetical protein PHN88_16195 [Ignavibacteria bacterium]|nr:hypothetical protein [Ignavibacteria bacterium]